MSHSVSAVLLAAGLDGEGGRSSAFLELAGRSLLSHCIDKLRAAEVISEIVVVVPGGGSSPEGSTGSPVADMVQAMGVNRIVPGGPRRQDSSRAGFGATDSEADIVLVHEAVRPLVSPGLIRQLVAAAAEHGAAVPALPATDGVKEGARGFLVRSIPRSVVYLSQTPQVFRRPLMARMFHEVESSDIDVDDDAEMAEVAGIKVRLIPGERTNLKIATSEDLLLAELVLRRLSGMA